VGIEDLQLRIEIGLDFRQLDLGPGLHLQMDRGVLRLLLLDLGVVHGERLLGLRPNWKLGTVDSDVQ
jgi:hypothetical protein